MLEAWNNLTKHSSRYGDKSTPSICSQLWTANRRHTYWNVWSHYAKLPPQPVRYWCPLWQILQSPIYKKFSNHLWQRQQTFSNRLERNIQGKIYDLPSVESLVKYFHEDAGYPVCSTWITAIKAGKFKTWPGLTYRNARRYWPSADETLKGYMVQTRQNVLETHVDRKSVVRL